MPKIWLNFICSHYKNTLFYTQSMLVWVRGEKGKESVVGLDVHRPCLVLAFLLVGSPWHLYLFPCGAG